jgi:hypothetical protein
MISITIKKRIRLVMILFIFTLCSSVFLPHLTAEPCYVGIEKAGNFDQKIVQSLAVSLISKYISKALPIPNAGIKEGTCVYDVSLMESMDGFHLTLSGNNINSIGNSKQPGMGGLTQSLLRALYRSKDDDQTKKKICSEYPDIMSQDCKPIGAIVSFYDDQGILIKDRSAVKEGDKFNVMLQPNADLHAAIFNKDSNGNIFKIFPSGQVSSIQNPLKSDTQYFFPPQDSKIIFEFDNNPGEEVFYFVFSSTPLYDIDKIYNSISNSTSQKNTQKLTKLFEKQIQTRGIGITKKDANVVNDNKNQHSIVGELLINNGAFVKTIHLNHVN